MRYISVAAGLAFAVVAMLSVGPARAEELKNDAGKCWVNTDKANYKWGDCKSEKKEPKGHSKKG